MPLFAHIRAEFFRKNDHFSWLVALTLVGGCSAPAEPDHAEMGRMMSDIETRVAVAKLGVQVCRSYRVGVSEENWVKGTVTTADGEYIVVTVNDPGRILVDVDGKRLEKGVKLREDVPGNWTPCL